MCGGGIAGKDDECTPVKYDMGGGDKTLLDWEKDTDWSDRGPAYGAVTRRLYRRRLQKQQMPIARMMTSTTPPTVPPTTGPKSLDLDPEDTPGSRAGWPI